MVKSKRVSLFSAYQAPVRLAHLLKYVVPKYSARRYGQIFCTCISPFFRTMIRPFLFFPIVLHNTSYIDLFKCLVHGLSNLFSTSICSINVAMKCTAQRGSREIDALHVQHFSIEES